MKEQFAPLLPDTPLREVTAGVRLNLGGGDTHIDGFVNVDRKSNSTDAAEYECYPLRYADGTVDEVRASHVLEHFPHAQTADVLADWVRVLKPGGVLRLAVPDFRKIAGAYLEGRGLPTQGYIMGGQVDDEDYHKAIFDEVGLREALRNVGLRNIRHWQSEIDDCAALPISLNLQGEKPRADPEKLEAVSAVMSVPRLGFMDNFFCSFQALVPLGIPLRKYTGAFWGSCLTRSIEEAMSEGAKWVLTMDYDTIFDKQDLIELMDLASRHPELDAIAPIQASRTRATPLFTIRDADKKNKDRILREDMDAEYVEVSTAHFGLTLIKVSAIQKMERPWFMGEPGPDGRWDDGRVDDDIYFWNQFEKAGNRLAIACRVPVGHAELMVRWPDENLSPIYQHPSDFFKNGTPSGCWK